MKLVRVLQNTHNLISYNLMHDVSATYYNVSGEFKLKLMFATCPEVERYSSCLRMVMSFPRALPSFPHHNACHRRVSEVYLSIIKTPMK